MFQTIERQMSDVDRQRLFECMPLTPSPFRPFHTYQFGLQIIGETFGVLMCVFIFVGIGDLRLAYGVLGGLGFLAVLWFVNLKRRVLTPLRRWRDENQRSLAFHRAVAAAQTIRVHIVEADSVVQVTYDEGTICLFDVGHGQTYWIDPYSMTPGIPPKDWPCRKFEVHEIPGWKEEIGPFCQGKRLRPHQTFEFQELFEHDSFEPPKDGLIHQTLDDFLTEARNRNRKVGAT